MEVYVVELRVDPGRWQPLDPYLCEEEADKAVANKWQKQFGHCAFRVRPYLRPKRRPAHER